MYSNDIQKLSDKYWDITYRGLLDPNTANDLIARYNWGLLPIEDEVTKYAFPSKSSSYISCGVNILSICSEQTSVAKWVVKNNYGINSPPTVNNLANIFLRLKMDSPSTRRL